MEILLKKSLILLGIILLSAGNLFAQETTLMVRVQAKDAKFIGSSIGGARIIIKDTETGEILAEGTTRGSTGNTNLIMKQPRERNKALADENTAGFEAILDLEKPVFVTIEAYAPKTKKQATVLSSTQLWLIPGKDITGDGIVLEVPGFVVDVLSPQTHENIASDQKIEIRANVVLMCGCPVTAGGLWDAHQYEVVALIEKEGETTNELEMQVQEKPSTFLASTNLQPGNYTITVYAFDPVSGNTGLDKTNIIVN